MNVFINDELASNQFAVTEATFEQVLAENPDRIHEASFVFGGQPVQTRIVGHQLARQIFRPFSHLRTDATTKFEPQLTIDLWDENETKIRRQTDSTIDGGEWYAYTETSPENRFFTERLPNAFTCMDRQVNRVIGSIAWSDQIFIYERARPLSRMLLEWHNDQKIQIIHGGLVSRNGQGVLFAGRSGSGKSTSALACYCGGFQFLSEDFVGLERQQDGSFWGHSIYNSVFLETEHLTRFPTLQPYTLPFGHRVERKSGVILSQISPERLERVAPITVLIYVHVTNNPGARIRSASKAEALLALGPSSLFQIPSRGRNTFTKLTELIESVPTYCLETGEDLQSIPRCVEELLEKFVCH